MQPYNEVPAFVELIREQSRDGGSFGGEFVEVARLSPVGPLVERSFSIVRSWGRRFLIKVHTGWEVRRRAGSTRSVPFATLRSGRHRSGWQISGGGTDGWDLQVDDPLFCQLVDSSGRSVATCEWGELVKVGDSARELRTTIVLPDGPNLDLSIDVRKEQNIWTWDEALRQGGAVVAAGSAGSFIKTNRPVPLAAVLLWWVVHRRHTVPYLPKAQIKRPADNW